MHWLPVRTLTWCAAVSCCCQIEVEADADEDVVFQESESTRNLTCPVTQLEMENPLRKSVITVCCSSI